METSSLKRSLVSTGLSTNSSATEPSTDKRQRLCQDDPMDVDVDPPVPEFRLSEPDHSSNPHQQPFHEPPPGSPYLLNTGDPTTGFSLDPLTLVSSPGSAYSSPGGNSAGASSFGDIDRGDTPSSSENPQPGTAKGQPLTNGKPLRILGHSRLTDLLCIRE